MNIHEYQAKELFEKFGVATSPGKVAGTPEEAEAAAKELADNLVVKAQIHAGGRGKGTFKNGFKGGVHLVQHRRPRRRTSPARCSARRSSRTRPDPRASS